VTTFPAESAERLLRCVDCGDSLQRGLDAFDCRECGRHYPIAMGTVRMLPGRLLDRRESDVEAQLKERTGSSFAYEWTHFGEPRPEWRQNFLGYMQPHSPEFFAGKRVLDVGTGSGRHAREAAALGADVVAVDVGDAIDIARRNLPGDVMTIQADLEELPFRPASFDFVMSIGVLHHLPDTSRALRRLVSLVKPGGHLHVYLYWQPPHTVHRVLLRGVSAVRRITTRMPHPLLHLLTYPISAVLFVLVVGPYRLLRRIPPLDPMASWFPLRAYADYPFPVLVNDQFDRFSAPIEQRFTSAEVQELMDKAGFEEIVVLPHFGWIADGRRPPES
jgi:SAM-dependent methyltransferase